MADKTNADLKGLVKILTTEMKKQSLRIQELEKRLSERINNVEKSLNDEKHQTDKRFDSAIERFDSCDNTIVDHIDSIDELETKYNKVTTQISDLTIAIKKVEDEMKDMENIKFMKVVNNENVDNDEEMVIKQCKYDRIGFCKNGSDHCNFFHSLETCQSYLERGFCNKLKCRKRHPRPCVYFKRCFCKRDSDCRYLHRVEKEAKECDKCENNAKNTYYCEFCSKGFCFQFTVEKAHIQNVYSHEDPGCQKINL